MRQRRELIEKFNKIHIDVLDSYFTDDVPEGYRTPGLYYMGKTVEMLGREADAVFFAEGWQQCRGCRLERKICEEYDIMILDENFFKPDRISIKRI